MDASRIFVVKELFHHDMLFEAMVRIDGMLLYNLCLKKKFKKHAFFVVTPMFMAFDARPIIREQPTNNI